jgi:hypothetical protein
VSPRALALAWHLIDVALAIRNFRRAKAHLVMALSGLAGHLLLRRQGR